MYYIVQQNLFREFHFNTLIDYLKRYDLKYEVIPFRPFSNELEFETKEKNVFCFGSVNLAFVAKQYNWFPGSLYNDNHNFEVYGPKYGRNMLNSDGFVIEASDELPEQLPYAFFARPTKDTKIFSGQCFTKDSWRQYLLEVEQNSSIGYITDETKILVAPLKSNIQQEIRCWVVNGKVITMSQYKIGNRVNMLSMDNNEEARIFAQDMIKLYQPAAAFVLDICLYEDEYKVVEINCLNCSGFYDLNMSKLIQSLEDTFNIT